MARLVTFLMAAFFLVQLLATNALAASSANHGADAGFMSPLNNTWVPLPSQHEEKIQLSPAEMYASDSVTAHVSACQTHRDRFTLSALAQELPQLFTELGTWTGKISCFIRDAQDALQPIFSDAPFQLNTTIDTPRARLLSCTAVAGTHAACRALHPYFDGSRKYCIEESADLVEHGYPLFRVSQLINQRLAIDSAWSDADDMASAGLNYYEMGNSAISGYFGTWPSQNAAGAEMNPALQCMFRVRRTCRGPQCFSVPPVHA